MCCSTGTLLIVIMSCKYWKTIFSHKYYICRKMNFTTALWIRVCLVLRGKEHGNFFGTFVLYSEYSTCWHWQQMCGGQVIYLTLSLVLFLTCLQENSICILFKSGSYFSIPELFNSNWKQNHTCVCKDIIAALRSAWFLFVLITFWGPKSNNKKIQIIWIWRNNRQISELYVVSPQCR